MELDAVIEWPTRGRVADVAVVSVLLATAGAMASRLRRTGRPRRFDVAFGPNQIDVVPVRNPVDRVRAELAHGDVALGALPRP